MAPALSHISLEPFGIEVKLDLAAGLSSSEKEELRRLYARDGLLLIRGLRLGLEEQMELCSIFGPVLHGPGETYIVSNDPQVGILGNVELIFHNDIPYVPAPYRAGALYAIEVSGEATATRFASGLRAYERLPESLRQRVDGLNTLQIRTRALDRRNRLTDAQPTDNCAIQALVGRQRESKRPYLFAGETHTACIIGMSEAESDALLEELFGYFYAPDNVYEHSWKTGDIVIWDNLAVHHARKTVSGGRRTLQRVSMNEFAYWDQYPVDRATFDSLYTLNQEQGA